MQSHLTEEWRQVVGWEGLYECSSEGRLRNAATGRILTTPLINGRYPAAHMRRPGSRRIYTKTMHRLVAYAFHGSPPSHRHDVDHLNGDEKKTVTDIKNIIDLKLLDFHYHHISFILIHLNISWSNQRWNNNQFFLRLFL